MAKYEARLRGNFDDILNNLDHVITSGSVTASYEDGSDIRFGNMRCAVRVYERYSMMGGNRVSMSVTLVGEREELFLSAITAGGSQATFFKLNTWGEEAFLETLAPILDQYAID